MTERLATLVDTNVLFDLATADPVWAAWSIHQLEAASLAGSLFINDTVYAEVSVRFSTLAEVDRFIDEAGLQVAAIPRQALFLAGKAFQAYRDRGGPRTTILPDFLIGAHAMAADASLLTRDARRYRTAFPRLRLVTP